MSDKFLGCVNSNVARKCNASYTPAKFHDCVIFAFTNTLTARMVTVIPQAVPASEIAYTMLLMQNLAVTLISPVNAIIAVVIS